MGLTMEQKQAVTQETYKRYQEAGKKNKSKILEEFTKTTGYNRKYAISLLKNWEAKKSKKKDSKKKPRKKRAGKLVYGDDVIASLRIIWAFFGYKCGKLLAVLLRDQMSFFEGWEPFHITSEIKEKLIKISPSTIERRLKQDRQKLILKGKSCTKPAKKLLKGIKIRTHFTDEERQIPGFFEVDTVHHCGAHDSGEYNLSLTATDVCSGWVELFGLLNKAQKWTFECLSSLPKILPFPLLELHPDNGSEFITHYLKSWCINNHIDFTRSRSYHKNDNSHVEQKNNACVRNYVGYYRFDTASERDALNSVYHSLCPLLNYFMPTMKLIRKIRVGSKIHKVYEKTPKNPYQRLLESSTLSDDIKKELFRRYKTYNPILLQQQVHETINSLLLVHEKKFLPTPSHK